MELAIFCLSYFWRNRISMPFQIVFSFCFWTEMKILCEREWRIGSKSAPKLWSTLRSTFRPGKVLHAWQWIFYGLSFSYFWNIFVIALCSNNYWGKWGERCDYCAVSVKRIRFNSRKRISIDRFGDIRSQKGLISMFRIHRILVRSFRDVDNRTGPIIKFLIFARQFRALQYSAERKGVRDYANQRCRDFLGLSSVCHRGKPHIMQNGVIAGETTFSEYIRRN